MKKFATDVIQFNTEVLGIKDRPKGLLDVDTLIHMTACLREEVSEFETAHLEQDYIGGIDALIDLMYFAVGGLHKMGVTADEIDQCASAIHQCNMTKKRGVVPRRGDGTVADATKPSEWVGPEQQIAKILGGEV